ncbi:MAG: excinuclease ABC subunit UvrB [Candidatus Paceibacterota bacterium]
MSESVFKVTEKIKPSPDQKNAINEICHRIKNGEKHVVLHGATGTGKTATTAWVIEKIGKPTLILTPNKVLAAQFAAELRELLPENSVSFFVSHFAYYRPEAYVPSSDTYIEKDSAIDDEIERLRHQATLNILTRKDVVIVASVSAIYGLGRPDEYRNKLITLVRGQTIDRDDLIKLLVGMEYRRNDVALERGRFRVRGDVVDIMPSSGENIYKISFYGDEVETLSVHDQIHNKKIENIDIVHIPPASHHVFDITSRAEVLTDINEELNQRLTDLRNNGKILEAERLKTRTLADIESLENTGFCSGIENYSMHFDRRKPGEPPSTLVDYFQGDFLTVIDESHITVPQISAMYEGDRSRKQVLVDHGFRLPTALDNRPLRQNEFWGKISSALYLTATPSRWEKEKSVNGFVEQIIRPTHLLDPEVIVLPSENRVLDLLDKVKVVLARNERVLVTTITKTQAEQLSAYLLEQNIKAKYLHHDVSTVERITTLRDLRRGKVEVVVGVNLLREGLDLPEVALVAIFDADTEGFLRSSTSLIQTIGRAARNPNGLVIMYADKVTPAMEEALNETSRRRSVQEQYNKKHGYQPKALNKQIKDVLLEEEPTERTGFNSIEEMREYLEKTLQSYQENMNASAKILNFEEAAYWREECALIRKELIELEEASKLA